MRRTGPSWSSLASSFTPWEATQKSWLSLQCRARVCKCLQACMHIFRCCLYSGRPAGQAQVCHCLPNCGCEGHEHVACKGNITCTVMLRTLRPARPMVDAHFCCVCLLCLLLCMGGLIKVMVHAGVFPHGPGQVMKVRRQIKAYVSGQLAACTEADPQHPDQPFQVRSALTHESHNWRMHVHKGDSGLTQISEAFSQVAFLPCGACRACESLGAQDGVCGGDTPAERCFW
jgi:hypothetical protein